MPDSFPRCIQQHSRTGEAHHQPHPFTHCRFVAMYRTLLARTLLLPERAMVETRMCIAEKFFAIRAKSSVLLLFPAIETNHQLYGSLFMCDALFLHLLFLNCTKIRKITEKISNSVLYLCSMRKLLCPQCKIAALYVKNDRNERLLVYVMEDGEVVPKNPADSMEGFDLTEVYCLGCSWHGSPKRLVKR